MSKAPRKRGDFRHGRDAHATESPFFNGLLGAINFVPGALLWRYAGAIERFSLTQESEDMERALGAQDSYWKFAGVLGLIGLALGAVGLIIAFVLSFPVVRSR